MRKIAKTAFCLFAAMLLTVSMSAVALADEPADSQITSDQPVADAPVDEEPDATIQPVPDTPYFSTVKNKKYGFYIKWSKVSGATGYKLYKKKGTGKFKLVKSTSKTYFKDKKTTVGYIYQYYVVAYKGSGSARIYSSKSEKCYPVRVYFKKGKSKKSKNAQAKVIAKRIAKSIGKKGKDVDRVDMAAYAVACFSREARYTMSGSDYRTPYGVFIKGEYSCAGTTRALGMVLTLMGFKWKHVNENQYTHQWNSLKMDGKKGWADGMMGSAGYNSSK